MTAPVAELVKRLQPAERKELDAHLKALAHIARPDVAYQTKPLQWLGDVLHIPESVVRWSLDPAYTSHRWDGSPDPLATICSEIAEGRDVAVESGTGTGKTYLAAGIALWFLACFPDALVVTTAPKEQQLTTQLWKEIGRHWPLFSKRYPVSTTVKLRVRMKEALAEAETWAVLGYACAVGTLEESATKAQGFHAAHMLIITEETPGIDPAVMVAFRNTCTGNHNVRLALGNPDHPRDALHQMTAERGVTAIRISALDHPNVVTGRDVVPGAVGRKSIAAKLDQYKSVDHPMYRSRVRGLCPELGTVPFPLAMVLKCDAPYSSERPAVWGWDVARAQDETVGIPLDAYGGVTKDAQRWGFKPWPEQIRDITALHVDKALGRSVPGVMDSTGVGDPVLQMAQSFGAPISGYVFTERSRQELLERLQGALLNVSVRGPFAEGGALHWVALQLETFEFVYTPGGVSWRCPEGLHDDGVMGLALAVYAYDHVSPRVAAVEVPFDHAKRDPNRWETYVGVGPEGRQASYGDGYEGQLGGSGW